MLLKKKIFPQLIQIATFKPLAIRSPELTDTVPDIAFISSQLGMQQGFACLQNVNLNQALISLSTGKKENAVGELLVESGQIYSVLAATCDILCLTFLPVVCWITGNTAF